MKDQTDQPDTFTRTTSVSSKCAAVVLLLTLSACGSTPEVVETVEEAPAWSINRVVQSDTAMISLLDPVDLAHHQAEPENWFMYDFAIKDDLQTGRFAAVVTERAGSYKVRVTFGELTEQEQVVAGPEALLRLRVINHRLLLSGGDAWPSVKTDYRRFANDRRWISVPNGDYGVIITALDPVAQLSDYVFQLIPVDDLASVRNAPALPQLIYGRSAAVVGHKAAGFKYNERCGDVPAKAAWVPLVSRTMPIPGAVQTVELPDTIHAMGIRRQNSGENAAIPMVLARSPEAGSYGFYVKPDSWSANQVQGNSETQVDTLIRCAVKIIDVAPEPDSFQLRIQAIPTAIDRISQQEKSALTGRFQSWMTYTNDPAWRFKTAKIQRTEKDSALILGILEYLSLSSKESEVLLPMSNALRVNYLLDRIHVVGGSNDSSQ